MTLKEYALSLRDDLYKDSSPQNVERIVNEIVNGKFQDGTPFSDSDIETILECFSPDIHGYDRESDTYLLCQSSNVAHMKLLNYVKSKVRDVKGK